MSNIVAIFAVFSIMFLCDYVVVTQYTPQIFDKSMLIDKKFRCIRYYDDTSDYNKHMEKTCEKFKIDYTFFNSQKIIYQNIMIITMFFGVMILI